MHLTPMLGFLMGKSPMELFVAGGVVMWPMLLLSLVAMTVTIERLIFFARERARRKPREVESVLDLVAEGKQSEAAQRGRASSDAIARVIGACAAADKDGQESAFAEASSGEISRYQQGVAILDTAITTAPLLGLLGTVTGMMGSFGNIAGELGAPTAITGGIAEALVATACGLFVAVMSLLPYNFVNARIDGLRRELEDSGYRLERALERSKNRPEVVAASR